MEQQVTIDPTLLVEQGPWVKRLAHNLVRDPYRAEDVAQETLLAALAAPPRDAADARRLRAWLGRVAFNLAHLSTRRNVRRRTREEHAAQSEIQASTADAVIRSSVLEQVVGSVARLPEPYRSAVHLRYFEGLSTADIADRTETTESAVRKRLWRARRLLRRTLDARHNGERQAWFNALLPLVGPLSVAAPLGPASPAGPAVPATITVGAAAKVAAGLLLLITAGTLWQGLREPGRLDPSSSRVGAGPASLLQAADLSRARTGSLETSAVESAAERGSLRRALAAPPAADEVAQAPAGRASSAPERSPNPATIVRGAVIDLQGNPLGGVPLASPSRPDEILGASAADGSFALPVSELPATFQGALAGSTTVLAARVEEAVDLERPALVVLAPTVGIGGWVVGPGGKALPAARVELHYGEEALTGLPFVADATRLTPLRTTAGVDGRFDLDAVPRGPGLFLRFLADGYRESLRPVPDAGRIDLVLELEPLPPVASRRLEGVVQDERGNPVPEALVRLGEHRTTSGSDGTFDLDVAVSAPGTSEVLIASRPGFAPRTLRIEPAVGGQAASDSLRIELRGTLAALGGKVATGDGTPARGWVVLVAEAAAVPPAPGEWLEPGWQEAPGQARAPLLLAVRTDDNGSFAVGVKGGRAYQVVAVDPVSNDTTATAVVVAEPGESGEGSRSSASTVLLADGPTVQKPTRVRLVDAGGSPLSSLRVNVSVELALGAGPGTLGSEVSDPDGWIALPALAGSLDLEVVHPLLGSMHVKPMGARTAASTQPAAVVVDVPAGVRVHTESASSFAVLDQDGVELSLGTAGGLRSRGRIFDGRSPLVTVPGEARTVVLFEGEEEVARARIAPVPGSVTPLFPERP